MLIPDLLNTLFDQSDYATLTILRSLHKRKTAYANKYSILIHYDIFDMFIKNIEQISEEGGLKTMKLVAMTGTNINIISISAIISFSAKGGHIEAVKYLMSIGIEFDTDYFFNHGSVFHYCICDNYFDMIKYLMSIVNLSRLQIAICLCAKYGRLEMMKYIIAVGDKYIANFRSEFDDFAINPAFRISAISNHINCVMFFVENGADVNRKNGSILTECAERGHLDITKYLVSKGVNVNTDYGLPVLCAAMSGHLSVVKFLVGQGAHVNVKQRFAPIGNIFEYCEHFGYHEIAKYLWRGVKRTKN